MFKLVALIYKVLTVIDKVWPECRGRNSKLTCTPIIHEIVVCCCLYLFSIFMAWESVLTPICLSDLHDDRMI